MTQTYTYDPISRLKTLTNDLAGTAYDLSIGTSTSPISYNPASQITSAVRSNDAYAWTGAVNTTRGYTSNGLNQYLTAGATSFNYDAENHLTSAVDAGITANLSYDPLGRLWKMAGSNIGDRSFVSDGNEIAADYVVSTGSLYHRYVLGPGQPGPADAGQPIVEYDGSDLCA